MPYALDRRIVTLSQYTMRQIFVVGRTVMQLILIFVVLVFSIGLILYASPIVLYIAPLIMICFVISFLTDSCRHHSKTVRH